VAAQPSHAVVTLLSFVARSFPWSRFTCALSVGGKSQTRTLHAGLYICVCVYIYIYIYIDVRICIYIYICILYMDSSLLTSDCNPFRAENQSPSRTTGKPQNTQTKFVLGEKKKREKKQQRGTGANSIHHSCVRRERGRSQRATKRRAADGPNMAPSSDPPTPNRRDRVGRAHCWLRRRARLAPISNLLAVPATKYQTNIKRERFSGYHRALASSNVHVTQTQFERDSNSTASRWDCSRSESDLD